MSVRSVSDRSETIHALASARGAAGVAVIRISGPGAFELLERLSGRPCPSARKAVVRAVVSPGTGETLDAALVICFSAPHSFTGEDVAEIHCHGGRAVVDGILEAIGSLGMSRLAEPGEFTRRAFQNGQMDLTAAEAIGDLVSAETAAQRRLALQQMGGALADLYDGWRDRLMRALAHLEASIDFADEELPDDLVGSVNGDLARLRDDIADHLADGHRGERIRDGVMVAIVGPPNAGKSSLLNALARREAAIVSERAGTTRDVIEVHMDIGGYPVMLSDTAGVRATTDSIEDEGVRRARARGNDADLRLIVLEAGLGDSPSSLPTEWFGEDSIIVLNKIDLAPDALIPAGLDGSESYRVSVRTGDGLDSVLGALEQRVAGKFAITSAVPLTRSRHREALTEAERHLTRALEADLPELMAEDVRLTMRELGRITGRVDVEDLLDVIFRDFCIGK